MRQANDVIKAALSVCPDILLLMLLLVPYPEMLVLQPLKYLFTRALTLLL
jgi:hypothetical protein